MRLLHTISIQTRDQDFMRGHLIDFLRHTVRLFLNDGMLSRGASVAFYTLTTLAPLLAIIVIVASVLMGGDQAGQQLLNELSGLVGHNSAEFFNHIMNYRTVSENAIGAWLGLATIIFSASGAFGEIQSGLNKIWSAQPVDTRISQLLRTRALSLALVGLAAFLLVVSLIVSAGLTIMADKINTIMALGTIWLSLFNFILSYGLLTILFAAIYKFLPDTPLAWQDVWHGAAITALLFIIGKSLIGFYLGKANLDSVYGAMGAPIIVALWIYYSTQIFFLGAEMTKVYAHLYGTRRELSLEAPANAGITQPQPMRSRLSGASVALVAAAMFTVIHWGFARSHPQSSARVRGYRKAHVMKRGLS